MNFFYRALLLIFVFVFMTMAARSVDAADLYSHVINLESGWNIVSTPRLLSSHQFSASSTSSNYDIYVLNPNSVSKWSTMAEIGQTEFLPLYGYFINNKTGTTTTLTLNYRQDVAPNERFFSRIISAGWNSIGVANPSYALKQKDPDGLDTNNVKNIIDSIGSNTQLVYDLTASQNSKDTTSVGDNWSNAIFNDANSLDDFRETKAYVTYNNVSGTYIGSQNNNAVSMYTEIISSGRIVVSKKSTSPSATTIIKGSDNIVLLANIRADEVVTADGMKVQYGSGANDAITVNQFENVRVYLNGSLLDSFDPAATSSSLITAIIDSTLTLNKGDNEVKIMAKAKTTATSNAAFHADLDGTNSLLDGMNPEYVSSNNIAVDPADISGSATGAIFTVQGAALTVVRNDGYADGKIIVKGGTDISLGKFVTKAVNDEVKITSIVFAGNSSASTTDVLPSSISDTKIYVDGVQVGNSVDFGTSGSNFSSLSIVVAKDTSKTIELKGTFDSSATGGFKTVMTVNSQDSRGTTVSPSDTPDTADFAVVEAGSLNVDLGGNTPPEAMIATIGSMQEIAQIKLTAINDTIDLTEMNFVNSSNATGTPTATSDADSLVSNVYLYDGTTLIDSTNLVSGAGQFKTENKVRVTANGNKTLSVKVALNNIVNDAAATNKDIRFAVTTINSKSSAGTATGLVTENVIANSFRVRKTIPTVALMALPTTLLTAGDQVVSKFTVTADANGDVSLKKVVLTTSVAGGATITGIGSNAVKVNGSAKDVASVVGSSTLTVTFATDEVISAGTTKTFEILATLAGGVDGDSVTTKITEEGSYLTNGTGNFVWSDGADIVTPTYSNSHRVSGLSTATQVLSK